MKYLVIGLGEFGRTLAEELTDQFNDVIGIDCNELRVNSIKNRISLAYIMDSTDASSLAQLPLDDLDGVIVAIGQSLDVSLRTVAALKENGVKNIYARAIDQTHLSILNAMSVTKVFIPEKYAAQMYVQNESFV